MQPQLKYSGAYTHPVNAHNYIIQKDSNDSEEYSTNVNYNSYKLKQREVFYNLLKNGGGNTS